MLSQWNKICRVGTLAVCVLLLAVIARGQRVDVFDMPLYLDRHRHLLELLEDAAGRQDHAEMARICRQGLNLGTDMILWCYNLACALALQGDGAAAIQALQQSWEYGLSNEQLLLEDARLDNVRELPAYQEILERIRARNLDKSYLELPGFAEAIPDSQGNVVQNADNTHWDFTESLFNTKVKSSARPPVAPPYRGPEAANINRWLAEGSAGGCWNILYVDRDARQLLSAQDFPGLMCLQYDEEVKKRGYDIDLPRTFFTDTSISMSLTVIGNASTWLANDVYGRSPARAVMIDPAWLARFSMLHFFGQMYFMPTLQDYRKQGGDLHPGNQPYVIAVVGDSGVERTYMEAALAALAAMPLDVRLGLHDKNLLIHTLNMLIRANQRTVLTPTDYLTSRAHPVAFAPENLDTARLVAAAHALKLEQGLLPAALHVQVEEPVDRTAYFNLMPSEHLYQTPCAHAFVFHGHAHTRTLHVEAECPGEYQRLHWVLLQGDPDKVKIRPEAHNPLRAEITVAHHEPFDVPLTDTTTIKSARVDIAVILENNGNYSQPSFISYYFPPNEKREYDAQGRLLSIDYRWPHQGRVEPVVSAMRNWRDEYQYSQTGTLTGWRRIRGLQVEEFSRHGHLIVSRDALGRPHRVHQVAYIMRLVQDDDGNLGALELVQMDDNVELIYRYTSDDDQEGTPGPP